MDKHEEFMAQDDKHAEQLIETKVPVIRIIVMEDEQYSTDTGKAMAAKIEMNGSHQDIMAALVSANVQVLGSLKERLGALGEIIVPVVFLEKMKEGLLGEGFTSRNAKTGEMSGEGYDSERHTSSPAKCKACDSKDECPISMHNVTEQ